MDRRKLKIMFFSRILFGLSCGEIDLAHMNKCAPSSPQIPSREHKSEVHSQSPHLGSFGGAQQYHAIVSKPRNGLDHQGRSPFIPTLRNVRQGLDVLLISNKL